MLKPLTLSLSFAFALGFCSVSMAGAFDGGCTTCGLASPQGGPIASPQGYVPTVGCDDGCAPRKKCDLFGHLGGKLDGLHCKLKGILHPPVTYEWVLKKKRLWGHKGGCDDGCGAPVTESVFPTSQIAPSSQGYAPAPSGQGYAPAPTSQGYAPAPAPVYGAGQHSYIGKPAAAVASLTGEEAPPAPEVRTGGLLLPTQAGE